MFASIYSIAEMNLVPIDLSEPQKQVLVHALIHRRPLQIKLHTTQIGSGLLLPGTKKPGMGRSQQHDLISLPKYRVSRAERTGDLDIKTADIDRWVPHIGHGILNSISSAFRSGLASIRSLGSSAYNYAKRGFSNAVARVPNDYTRPTPPPKQPAAKPTVKSSWWKSDTLQTPNEARLNRMYDRIEYEDQYYNDSY